MRTVGVVSPGAMGSAVADALARGGARVVATTAGRSPRTAALSAKVDLELLPDLRSVVTTAEVVLSIVPSEAAKAVARDVTERARLKAATPLFADLNAIAPETSRRLADVLRRVGCDYVDGSISGPPPWSAGTTRLYLSGERAHEVATLPIAGVECIVVGSEVGAASAVKMSTASVYKGSSALLAHALVSAEENGVLEHVLADLQAGSPELLANVARRLAFAAAKSGRYVGEMREIALTQAAAGLTPALFEAMAEVFESMSQSELARATPEDIPADVGLDEVLGRLRDA